MHTRLDTIDATVEPNKHSLIATNDILKTAREEASAIVETLCGYLSDVDGLAGEAGIDSEAFENLNLNALEVQKTFDLIVDSEQLDYEDWIALAESSYALSILSRLHEHPVLEKLAKFRTIIR